MTVFLGGHPYPKPVSPGRSQCPHCPNPFRPAAPTNAGLLRRTTDTRPASTETTP